MTLRLHSLTILLGLLFSSSVYATDELRSGLSELATQVSKYMQGQDLPAGPLALGDFRSPTIRDPRTIEPFDVLCSLPATMPPGMKSAMTKLRHLVWRFLSAVNHAKCELWKAGRSSA